MTQLSPAMIHNHVILPNMPSFELGEASTESFAAEWAKMALKTTEVKSQTSENLQPESPEAVLIEQPDPVADHSDIKKSKVEQLDDAQQVSAASGPPRDGVLNMLGATGLATGAQDDSHKATVPHSDPFEPQLPTEQKAADQRALPDSPKGNLPKQVSADAGQSSALQPVRQPVLPNGDAKSESVTPKESHIPAPAEAPVPRETPVQNPKQTGLVAGVLAPSGSTQTPQPVAVHSIRPVAELILQGFTSQAVQGQTVPSQPSLPPQMAPINIARDAQPQSIHPHVERAVSETLRTEQAARDPSVRSEDSLKVVRPQTSEQQPTFGDGFTSRTEFRPTERAETLRYETQPSVQQTGTVSAPALSPPVFFGAPTISHDLNAAADQLSVLPVVEPDLKTVVSTISPQASPSKPELAQVVVRQLAVVVPQVSDRPVEVLLNPEELGRVRMVMLGQDAQMVVQIHADKPETSDLIRRHLDMLAQDFQPDRLQVSKEVAKQFVDKREFDRIGLVVFAGESFTQCPLTTDHRVVKDFLDGLQCGMLEDGTAIGMGLASAVNRMKDSDSKSKVVILLTDGVNNSGYIKPLTASEIAQELETKVYTIGVGTRGQALSPVSRRSDGRYIFGMANVEIDERLLEEIANMTGGQYYRATDQQSLESIYAEIDRLEKTEMEITSFRRYSEEFRRFLSIGIILLLIDLLLRLTVFKTLP